jgi:hypothetical protein
MQFTKLFNSILDSTIWQEPPATKLVWITLLAMSDRNGEVFASIPGLAKRAGVTLAECESALLCLKSPDKYSRTKDHEGRRIEEGDGSFRLLNHGKYRALLSAEERKEYNRKKQAEYRASQKMSMTVNDSQSQSAKCTHTEAEAEAEAEAEHTPLPPKPQAPPSLKLEGEQSKPTLTPEQIEVASWLNRRPTTPWSAKELKAWKQIPKPIDSEDWQALKWFYTRSGCKYLRRDLCTLLNNWTGEIDRAKNYDPNEK